MMSGEIDIEEHDLMDNPRVRTIFPDLTLLKKEIVDTDLEESEKIKSPNTPKRPGEVHEKQSTNINASVTCIKEEFTNKKKLIRQAAEFDKLKNLHLSSNVIVFGTKPSKTIDKKLKYDVKINLIDINHQLKISKCYCQICKTLFSKTNVYEQHYILNHKDTFSNHRDSVGGQDDNVSQIIIEGNVKNKCFHCKKVFSTQGLLIEHLYEVLDKKAKARKYILDNDYQAKSNDNHISQQASIEKNTAEKDTDKTSGTKSVENNSISETLSVDSCKEISTEKESCCSIDKQIEVLCGSSCTEALQCSICSYYFQHKKFFIVHMEKKHRTKVEQVNVVKFNPKCVFCSNIYPSIKQYNAHLHRMHSSMIFDTNSRELTQINKIQQSHEDSNSLKEQPHDRATLCLESSYDLINDRHLLFKSVLFKCLKCEIHFLSPKLATSHMVHIEILINWKCPLCKIFFKRSDEDLHLKQHKYTELFTVVDVEDKDFSRIMIKCVNCSLHIPKNDLRHHLNDCGQLSINIWHCSICNINIDGNNKRQHNNFHRDMDNKENDFILINDSFINTQTYMRDVDQDLISEEDISYSVESNDSDIDSYSPDESNNDSPANIKKSSHVKSNSTSRKKSNLKNKSTIQDGLNNKLITEDRIIGEQNNLKRKLDASVDSSKKLRRKLKEVCSANDEYYSKFIFKPPDNPTFLLNLSYCKNCECFINFYYMLSVHLEKRCNNSNKRVCNVCGIVFTPKLIVRHKEFHKLNPHLKLQDFRFYDIETCEQVLPPIPTYPKCEFCGVSFLNKDEKRCHTCAETPNLYCDICEQRFATEEVLNLHIPFHGYYIQSESHIEQNSDKKEGPVVSKENNKKLNSHLLYSVSERRVDKDNQNNNKCENEVMDIDEVQVKSVETNSSVLLEESITQKAAEESSTNETPLKNNEEVYYLYTCEFCKLTVSDYDLLVEHCHSHCNNNYKNIDTTKCTECNLIFDSSSIFLHKQIHKPGLSNEFLKTFVCDLYFFGLSNADWLNHVFKSLPVAKRERIIKNAIYKNECRVKLDIAQEGDPELTLYQCSKCSIFIDDSDVFTHRKVCKGKNKKYPCDFCGIALVSEAHRSRHLKLHEQHNLSIKSYRILVFNRLKHKTLNDLIFNKTNQYVIYKCRNCQGVVEWRFIKRHNCNFHDLRKCNNCGLLIYNRDYEKHESKHKSFDAFVASNMKVVMFGQIGQQSKDNKNDMVCSFSGIAFDYILYKCIKCDVCIRDLRLSSRHFCLIDAAKWKCPKCLLFFDEGHRRNHHIMHATDAEFTSDFICVIPFDPQETYLRLEKELKSKGKNGDHEKESEDSFTVCVQEKTDTLYRCPCDLHYLTEENAQKHVEKNKCGVILKKNLIQTCSKCHLNFTPEILYKHLLQHHAEKYVKYSFDIINIGEHHLKKDSNSVKYSLRGN